MWTQTIIFSAIVANLVGDLDVSGIHREMSEGVQSRGYKITYRDEHLQMINQLVYEKDKDSVFDKRGNLKKAAKPLTTEDVKCLSIDRYCSKKMEAMKSVLIQAVKEDCVKCSSNQKDEASNMIASMMAHDPDAWKLFLRRYDGVEKVQKILG